MLFSSVILFLYYFPSPPRDDIPYSCLSPCLSSQDTRATALTFFCPENKDKNRNSSRKISHRGTEFTEDTKKDRNLRINRLFFVFFVPLRLRERSLEIDFTKISILKSKCCCPGKILAFAVL